MGKAVNFLRGRAQKDWQPCPPPLVTSCDWLKYSALNKNIHNPQISGGQIPDLYWIDVRKPGEIGMKRSAPPELPTFWQVFSL